jgi:hypothetical protein
MKSYLKFAALLLAIFALSNSAQAQNSAKTTPPASDALSGFTYDYNKAMSLIIDRITTPNKNNADVQVFLDHKDFPKLTANKTIDAAYKEQLRIWMEHNPDLIINTLKSRKDIVTQY